MRRFLSVLLTGFCLGLWAFAGFSFANLSSPAPGQGLPVPSVPVLSNQAVEALPLLPARGAITSNFGWRTDPMNGNQKFHAGLDIGAAQGAPVYSTQGGIVAYSGSRSGYGHVVVIQHHPQFYTLYAHLSQRYVTVGQRVEPGQTIALVGSSGRATGPHLHFETILNHQVADPIQYLTYLNQHPPISPKVYLANMQRPAFPAQSRSEGVGNALSGQSNHSVATVSSQKPKETSRSVSVRVPLPVPKQLPTVIRRFIPSSIAAPVPVPGLSLLHSADSSS